MPTSPVGAGIRAAAVAAIAAAMLTVSTGCAHPAPAEPTVADARTSGPLPVPAPMSDADRAASDACSAELLALSAALSPETSRDDPTARSEVTDWSAGANARAIEALDRIATKFDGEAAGASPAVAIDLALLADAARLDARQRTLEERLIVRLYEPAELVYQGVTSALGDEPTSADWDAAVARLRAYVADTTGATPVTVQAEARTRDALAATDRRVPGRDAVERSLARAKVLAAELRTVVGANAEAAELVDRFDGQLAAYDTFVRAELLPRTTDDPATATLPPELYALALEARGIDRDPVALAAQAHAAFAAIVAEMQPLSAEIASARGLPDPDYRAVIAALKRERIGDGELAEVYERRITEIEAILVREALVTLPERPLAFRLATEAESARIPAPMYLPPPPDRPGAAGTFVLPVRDPTAATGAAGYDDFNFDAASWWLTAHEGRPGHDLQSATIAAHPSSVARSVIAFNSTNAEGWGLYAEGLIAPFVPPEARLVVLQARLMRAAHAFLDIELNLGLIGPDEVRRVMVDEVGFSPAWAETCVQRYTTLMPGQAPSYFYGYVRLIELRRAAEARFGARFDPRAFHDAYLAQGMLPPDLMAKVILGSG